MTEIERTVVFFSMSFEKIRSSGHRQVISRQVQALQVGAASQHEEAARLFTKIGRITVGPKTAKARKKYVTAN